MPEEAVRCSVWARSVGLPPIATIGSYRGYLLVEAPLPWARDVPSMPVLAAAAERAAAAGVRLQALVPSDLGGAPADRRLILHAGPGAGGWRRYSTVAGGSLESAVERILDCPDELAAPGRDVLVCTHGRRDVCCGSSGTDLALQLAAAGPPPGVSLWRTSHTGGHRFAATFVVLPEATAWAFASPGLVGQVLARSVPFADVAGHYRGCAALPGPELQVLERAVLTATGWDLLDQPRGGGVVEGTARLEAGGQAWEARVRPGRRWPVPDCMRPVAQATKSEPEWLIEDVRKVR